MAMVINRRHFLRAALVAPALSARLQARQPPAPPLILDKGFARATRVADDVVVTIANPEGGLQCLSNGGVLIGRDALLVVEGHFKEEGAAFELEVARMVSNRPIRAAVNTHFHPDHSFGNIVYTRQGIPIIAGEPAPALMKALYADLKGVEKTPLLRPLEQKLEGATDAARKERFEGDLGAARWMYKAIDAVEISYPTELVSAASPRRIDLGGLNVLIELHPGHTPADVIVRVPDRDLAFVGDLLFVNAYPVSIDADMLAWRKVVEALAHEPRSMRLVPGHGPICGPEAARVFADLLDHLRAHAEKMIAAGAKVAEAEDRYVIPTPFKEYDASWWDWTIGAALRSYYAGLTRG
jgi:cyclase